MKLTCVISHLSRVEFLLWRVAAYFLVALSRTEIFWSGKVTAYVLWVRQSGTEFSWLHKSSAEKFFVAESRNILCMNRISF